MWVTPFSPSAATDEHRRAKEAMQRDKHILPENPTYSSPLPPRFCLPDNDLRRVGTTGGGAAQRLSRPVEMAVVHNGGPRRWVTLLGVEYRCGAPMETDMELAAGSTHA
jgi:hypothetical protein